MEIKVNKEIRSYSESVFMGLNLRQTICSGLAVAASVGMFFLCRDRVNVEVTSWLCMFAAAPFGAVGFIKYNQMPLEKFVMAWLQSELFTKRLVFFRPVNLYLESTKPYLENLKKNRRRKTIVKRTEKRTKT